jgi:hypothetical protein
VFVFAHGKRERRLATVAMDAASKGTRVAANGVLYLHTGTHLYAISAR